MLIACNSLIGQPALERRFTAWIRGLVDQHQQYSEILLTAIHFHFYAGQLAAVAELVCQTTGIKMTLRTNGMARIKAIFTSEIFTSEIFT